MDDLLILIALAVAPCLVIALLLYWREKFDREPFNLLVGSFFGGIASVVPAYFLSNGLEDIVLGEEATTPFELGVDAFVCTAFSEEISKYFFLRLIAYRNKNFTQPFDGITSAIMVAMGFAMVENLIYVLNNTSHGIEIALVRMFTAIPAHIVFAVILGYYVGMAKFKEHKKSYLTLGVVLAVGVHGLYDFSIFTQNPLMLYTGAALSLLFAIILFVKALQVFKKNKPIAAETAMGNIDFPDKKEG